MTEPFDLEAFERDLRRQDFSNPFHVEIEAHLIGEVYRLIKEAARLKLLARYARHHRDCTADDLTLLHDRCQCGLTALESTP